MGGDIEKFCYAATVRSPPFPQSFVKKCGGKDGRFSPIPRLIVASCQVKCNSKLEKISEGEFQLRHLRGR